MPCHVITSSCIHINIFHTKTGNSYKNSNKIAVPFIASTTCATSSRHFLTPFPHAISAAIVTIFLLFVIFPLRKILILPLLLLNQPDNILCFKKLSSIKKKNRSGTFCPLLFTPSLTMKKYPRA